MVPLAPGDLPADADGRLPFWKPGYLQVAKSLGWGWIRIGGLMIGIIIILIGTLSSRGLGAWSGSFVWWVIIGIAVVGGISDTVWQVTKTRKDLYCIHCGYTLEGLPNQHKCPECGRPYSFELIREYQQDPKSFVQRWQEKDGRRSDLPSRIPR